jgi:type I restriction enzyme S subunit
MAGNWFKSKLQDLDIIFEDGDRSSRYPKANQFLEQGNHPFINTKNIVNNHFQWENVNFISDLKFEEIKKGRVKKDDVVIATRGSKLGKVAYYDGDKWAQPLVNAQLLIIRCNDKRLHPKFLWLLLSSSKGQLQIESLKSGSAQPQLPIKDLKKFEIEYPNYQTQLKILETSNFLNEKIQLTKQINQTLEQMAQALFQSWFVNFDPVIDNALAAGSNVSDFPEALQQRAELRKQAQQLPDFKALPDDIHSLFPSEFEQTDESSIGIDGLIPKGWKVSSINEFNAINPESWTKKNAPDTVKYIDLANAKNGTILESVDYSFAEAPSRARRVLNKHDIIIGVVRPVNRSFAYVNECGLTGSTGFAVVRSKKENYRAFSYFSLTNDDCIAEFARIADGAAYPAIKPDDVAKAICLYSNEDILETFEKIAGQFLSKKAASEQQLKPLASLRDTLLPKLISGELTIPDTIKTENIVNHQQPKEPLSNHA